MPTRKKLQDIIPTHKASHKEAAQVHIHRHKEKEPDIETAHVTHIPQARPIILERPLPRRRPAHRHPIFLITIALFCIVAIIIAVSFVYANAVVTIIPKKDTITVDATFVACKDTACPPSISNKNQSFAYEVIQVPAAELHQTTPAIDGPFVQTNATGSVVLYNTYSTTPQLIAAGTRLSNTAGRVYKTIKSVTVPGFKKTGSTAVPGSVSVSIAATAAGAEYNILPTDLTGDFKVVAYKGTDKYNDFYARLNPANAITGGFSGRTKIVASSTLAQVYTTLKQKLAAQLLAQSTALIPDGYIMYGDAYSITYVPVVASSTTSASSIDVGMRATFYGIMFAKNNLVKAAALAAKPPKDVLAGYPNNQFTITGLDALTFTNPATNSVINQPFTFALKGVFTVTGTFPASDIISQLQGKTLAQSNDIFAKYSTIAGAHAILTPFWRHSFPNSPKKISIVVQ
ncbi:MAG: hypothetical protein WCQ60_02760 [bacterium]